MAHLSSSSPYSAAAAAAAGSSLNCYCAPADQNKTKLRPRLLLLRPPLRRLLLLDDDYLPTTFCLCSGFQRQSASAQWRAPMDNVEQPHLVGCLSVCVSQLVREIFRLPCRSMQASKEQEQYRRINSSDRLEANTAKALILGSARLCIQGNNNKSRWQLVAEDKEISRPAMV